MARFWVVGDAAEPDTCPDAIGRPCLAAHAIVRWYELDGTILGFRSDHRVGDDPVPVDERPPAGCAAADDEPACECVEVAPIIPLPLVALANRAIPVDAAGGPLPVVVPPQATDAFGDHAGAA